MTAAVIGSTARESQFDWVSGPAAECAGPSWTEKKKKEHTDKTETRVRLASAALVAMCELHM